MTIHLDTSALVDALTGPRRSIDHLIAFAEGGHRLNLSAIVLFEWLRGPRSRAELLAQEDLFPHEAAVAFGATQADIAAKLYRTVRKPSGREIDLAIAACAIADGAALWTLNRTDFSDLAELRLV